VYNINNNNLHTGCSRVLSPHSAYKVNRMPTHPLQTVGKSKTSLRRPAMHCHYVYVLHNMSL